MLTMSLKTQLRCITKLQIVKSLGEKTFAHSSKERKGILEKFKAFRVKTKI